MVGKKQIWREREKIGEGGGVATVCEWKWEGGVG